MATTPVNRKTAITLYSCPRDPYCHRTRWVLTEKNLAFETINVDFAKLPEDLIDLNPYQALPTLVDRELVLYDSRVIIEYLDERYPHPGLMPVDPVSKARTRLMLYRIDRDWYTLADALDSGDAERAAPARRELRESLMSILPLFAAKPFFISDDFTLIDCYLGPLLWRLRHWGIELPATAKPLLQYASRLFDRRGFKAALSEVERNYPGI